MENEKGIVKLTRKQLYDEIWALSVAGVARKYNLNYGKLIATCKAENVPFPSSGYWTRKNMGKDVSNEAVELSGHEETEISLITNDATIKRIRKATAIKNIEGDISIDEAQELLNTYYEENPKVDTGDRTEEADKVAVRIAKILSEKAFSFTPNAYISIHKKLFTGIYGHAGKLRDYNMTKREWVRF